MGHKIGPTLTSLSVLDIQDVYTAYKKQYVLLTTIRPIFRSERTAIKSSYLEPTWAYAVRNSIMSLSRQYRPGSKNSTINHLGVRDDMVTHY